MMNDGWWAVEKACSFIEEEQREIVLIILHEHNTHLIFNLLHCRSINYNLLVFMTLFSRAHRVAQGYLNSATTTSPHPRRLIGGLITLRNTTFKGLTHSLVGP